MNSLTRLKIDESIDSLRSRLEQIGNASDNLLILMASKEQNLYSAFELEADLDANPMRAIALDSLVRSGNVGSASTYLEPGSELTVRFFLTQEGILAAIRTLQGAEISDAST